MFVIFYLEHLAIKKLVHSVYVDKRLYSSYAFTAGHQVLKCTDNIVDKVRETLAQFLEAITPT